MEISRNGTRASGQGPAEHFTGNVRLDPLFQSPAPARASGAYVTFEPCARSDWHTHPLGQTLIVTFGIVRESLQGAVAGVHAATACSSGWPRTATLERPSSHRWCHLRSPRRRMARPRATTNPCCVSSVIT